MPWLIGVESGAMTIQQHPSDPCWLVRQVRAGWRRAPPRLARWVGVALQWVNRKGIDREMPRSLARPWRPRTARLYLVIPPEDAGLAKSVNTRSTGAPWEWMDPLISAALGSMAPCRGHAAPHIPPPEVAATVHKPAGGGLAALATHARQPPSARPAAYGVCVQADRRCGTEGR